MADDSERNSLTGRLRRYARVSGTMAGLGARMAGQRYLGLKIDRDRHAADLKAALGGLKGPLMKVAQLLATIPEAIPQEYADEFRQLQTNAPPMGWPFVKRRMAAELGRDWTERFASFEREAAAAASLGQVHKAHLHDGRLVAAKLQYPDMASAVEADLGQLRFIFSLFERYDRGAIRTGQIHAEISARLREELDYEREGRACQLFAEMLADEPGVHVPVVVPELSTRRLLTSTWLEGRPILDFKQASPEERARIALNLFRAWYVPLYVCGVVHGDPHLGNYSVRDDLAINLLDFGCIRVFPPRFIQGVIDLYRALSTGDQELAIHAYRTWGFKGLNEELVATLNLWASFLYGPLLENRTRLIGEATTGVYGRETAEQVHKRLRALGGVEVPREFVFMDRAALGLGSVFIHLQAEVNWHALFEELIAEFDVDRMAARQREMLERYGIDLAEPGGDMPEELAV